MSKDSAVAMVAGIPAPPVAQVSPQAIEVKAQPEQSTKALESPRIAMLMKKEAELVRQREEFKKQQELFGKDSDSLKAKSSEYDKFMEAQGRSKAEAMRMLGWTQEDIVNAMAEMEDKTPPEERARRAAQDEIAKFRQEEAKRQAEAKAVKDKSLIDNFRADIGKQVTADPVKYEYINHYGPVAEELIYNTVEETLRDSGELITIQEAADMVEAYYDGEAEKLLAKNKLKAKLQAQVPVETKPKAEHKPSPTLSSKTIATTASTTVYKKETPSEKRERLIAKLANINKA